MNPMCDILFDEKIAGSLHFTPGQASEKCDNGTAIESTCKSSCDHTVQAANEKGCKSEAQDLLDCADSHADTMCAGDPSTECTSENDKLDTCMGT